MFTVVGLNYGKIMGRARRLSASPPTARAN